MADTINIVKPNLSSDRSNFPRIFNFETVASYNWVDAASPTILVPGQSHADC